MAERIFGGKGSYEKYSLVERRDLGLKVQEFKQQYLLELEALKGKTHWDAKRKCHVTDQPKQGYLTRAVRSFYSNLSGAKSDSQEIKNACKLAKRCYEKLKRGDSEDGAALKTFRTTGGGRKSRAPEVREALFQWFIDVRTSLNALLPKSFSAESQKVLRRLAATTSGYP